MYLSKVMVKFNTSHIFQHNIKFYLLISYQFIDSYKTVTLFGTFAFQFKKVLFHKKIFIMYKTQSI